MAKATEEKEQTKKSAADKKEEEKQDKFDKTLDELEKQYGKGTIIMGKNVKSNLEVVSTGSLNLDLATNIGGWPIGCLIEMYGPESSGKTTITLHAIANFQKKFKDSTKDKIVFINPEHAFDRVYATAIGVDVDRLIINQPDTMEDMYNIAEKLIRTGRVRLVVIDSQTAALPKAVVEGEVGDVTMALQARLNSVALGKIKPLLLHNRCTLIGISQLRTKIGDYGDPDKPTGGNAWKFYTDMRIKVSKQIDKNNDVNKTTVDVVKSKVACPFGKAKFIIGGGRGVDRMMEVIDLAVEYRMLEKGGAGWYTLPDEGGKFQGDEKLKEFFNDNPEYAAKFEKDVLAKMAEAYGRGK